MSDAVGFLSLMGMIARAALWMAPWCAHAALPRTDVQIEVVDRGGDLVVPCENITTFQMVEEDSRNSKPVRGGDRASLFQGCVGRNVEWGTYKVTGRLRHHYLGTFTGTCRVWQPSPVCTFR